MTNESFIEFKRSYNQLIFGKFIFPKSIRKLLSDDTDLSLENSWIICYFFFKKSSLFQNNLFSFVRQFRHSELFIAFKSLEENHLMADGSDSPYFQALIAHPQPDKLALAYKTLQKAKISDRGIINLLSKYQRPDTFVPLFCLLKELDLLKSETIEPLYHLLLKQQNPSNLCYVLKKYKDAGLLEEGRAQALFEELLRYAHILVGDKATCDLWRGLSAQKLSLETYRHWMALLAEHIDEPLRGREVFSTLVSDIIFPPAPVPVLLGDNAFNGNQSTHTASIHATVSQSASKLWQRYSQQLLENTPLSALSAWLNDGSGEEKDKQLAAAKRCLARLIINDEYTDPKSAISLTSLLGLVWLAIHDDQYREGSLDDAKRLLIEALYEIQRGYNITEEGDNGLDDSPICFAGSFNKLLEKFWAVHIDIELVYITKKCASMKLVSIINEELMNYINRLNSPSPDELKAIYAIHLSQTIKPIFKEKIKAIIIERMFEEFGELWENDKSSEEFHSFIDAGRYAPLRNHSQKVIQQLLQNWQPELPYASNPRSFFKESPPLSCNDLSSSDLREGLIAETAP